MNVLCEASSSSKLWGVRWVEIVCLDSIPSSVSHTLNRPTLTTVSQWYNPNLQNIWPLAECVISECHFTPLYCKLPHCRSIQIVCSACYTWCYRITIQKSILAVQYSMYLNVCCAININVYNIFYNTEEADLIVWYELIWIDKVNVKGEM